MGTISLFAEYTPKWQGNDQQPQPFAVRIRRWMSEAHRREMVLFHDHAKTDLDVAESWAQGRRFLELALMPKLIAPPVLNFGDREVAVTTVAALFDATENDPALLSELMTAAFDATRMSEPELKNCAGRPGDAGTPAPKVAAIVKNAGSLESKGSDVAKPASGDGCASPAAAASPTVPTAVPSSVSANWQGHG